jgi:hypothetical protein
MRYTFPIFFGDLGEFKILVFSNSKDDMDDVIPERV